MSSGDAGDHATESRQLGDPGEGDIPGDTTQVTLVDMVSRLQDLTGFNYATSKQNYDLFVTQAHSSANASEMFDELSRLYERLRQQNEVGKIRGVESWADGTDEFKLVWKSWPSLVDKIYRLNVEENSLADLPPTIATIQDQADKSFNVDSQWVTPDNVHSYVDDMLRTKFVLPFVDNVLPVSQSIKEIADTLNLPCYRKYHAKDSGYHAHHVYALMPIPAADGSTRQVALEIKVLTKLQDTLGELTHLLYELKRTGQIRTEKKRKMAWLFDSPDFAASYIGHSAHYIESAIVKLKTELQQYGD